MMQHNNTLKITLTAGFAMFTMFFGSGNLVFPLLIGTQTLSQYPYAIVGLLITAVLVPFLGLLGVILYEGNRKSFFANLGKNPAFLLTFMMLALIGPFGVVARCLTVAYGGVHLLIPQLPFIPFSLGLCLLIAALIWKRHRVVDILGLVLTPWKLGGLLILIISGLWWGLPPMTSSLSGLQALTIGLKQGYQTMDLIAAFFFSATTAYYLRSRLKIDNDPKALLIVGLKSSLVGASILALVYIGFVSLGAKYAPILTQTPSEEILAVIAGQALGRFAIPIASLTILIACLATAVILCTLFAEFLEHDVSNGKISRSQAIFATVGIAFVISTLGFNDICRFLEMILEIVYPALIVLTLSNIVAKLFNLKQGSLPFWLTLAASSALKWI